MLFHQGGERVARHRLRFGASKRAPFGDAQRPEIGGTQAEPRHRKRKHPAPSLQPSPDGGFPGADSSAAKASAIARAASARSMSLAFSASSVSAAPPPVSSA